MFSWRLFTDGARVLALLFALSLVLLVSVSATPARSMQVTPLLVGLDRNLAALRAQLELMPAQAVEQRRQEAASNAGIADGGAAYRWEAIAAIMRGANRRLVELDARYRDVEDAPATARVRELRVELRVLEQRLARLRAAPEGAEAGEARAQADRTLASAERTLSDLYRPLPD